MPTTQELINERLVIANRITELLNCSVTEDGVININPETLLKLQELNELNNEDLISKAEAIVYAIKKLEAEIESYAETIQQYQVLMRNARNSVTYLTESLLPQIINEVGSDGKLPTPSFPKLRVRTFGKGKLIINEDYNAPIDPTLFKEKPLTLKDLDKKRIEQMIEDGTIPVDDDGNPLAFKTKPVLKATFR